MSKFLAFSLIICSLILGAGIGYVFTPQYANQAQGSMGMGLGQADRLVDLRYINAMAAHHRGAMLLAEQVKDKSQRAEVRELAAAILKNEPVLIDELYSWKKQWYKSGQAARDPRVAKLGNFDDKMDLRFLNALIAHHQDGVAMTMDIRLKSSRNEVLNNADAVQDFLTKSGDMLKGWRKQWYNVE